MGTLYIDRRDSQLDYHQGQVRIREPDGSAVGYPIAGLERVVVAGNLALQSRVLTQLADAGVSVLFLEGRGARRHAQVSHAAHGDVTRRIGQYWVCTTSEHAIRWGRLLVTARARALLSFYRAVLRQRPDLRRPLTRGLRIIEQRLPAIRQCRKLASLRGLEGAVSAAHFAAYRTMFAPALAFNGRNRRPPRDPVNAVLSLGYTISHADAVRACLIAGLDPMLGILHEPDWGRQSLACDLNEIARIHIESLVWRLFADQTLRARHFEQHAGGVTLKKSGRQPFYAAFETHATAYRRELRRAAAIFARHCAGQIPVME